MTTAESMKVSIFAHQKGNIDISIPEKLSVIEGEESKPKGFGMFRIINQKDGDKRVVWNGDILDEISDAKEMFDDLVVQGLVPYRVDSRGKKSPEIMDEFDPSAEEIIFAPIPALKGG